MKNATLPSRPWSQRALDWIEWAGNKLPDPAVLFLITLLLTYSMVFLAGWTLFLLAYWALGLPLGLQAGYVHPRWIQPLPSAPAATFQP